MKTQASKWLQLQALLDFEEMKALFNSLKPLYLFQLGVLSDGELTEEQFFSSYKAYITPLQSGKFPTHSLFAAALTSTPDAIASQPVANGKTIFSPVRPTILMKGHSLGYSPIDGKFRPNVMGKESITWGVQFSYPQLFQDEHGTVSKVDQSFSNTALFRTLQRWVRNNTLPTPFLIDEKKINVPMRIGKQCLPWINRHPQLVQQQIGVLYEH